ncbi:MAG: diguanylate cyclase [Candidatus Wenzhouxiangella sp. M2_3B_020]
MQRPLARFLYLACILLVADPAIADPDPLGVEEIDRKIERIGRVHVSEPWQQSQRMIDELAGRLRHATPEQRARLELMSARNRMLVGRHAEGIDLIERALSRPISPDWRGRGLELATNAATYLQDYGAAFEYLGQALGLMNDIDRLETRAGILSLAARLHVDVGEASLALRYAAEGRALAERSGDVRTMCDTWYTVVQAQESLGFRNFALENTPELWEACQRADDPVLASVAMSLIGKVHFAAGNLEQAIGWLERAIEANRAAGFTGGERAAALTLGKALIALGEVERGIGILDPLVEAFEANRQWGNVHEAQLSLADAHHFQGEHADAAMHLQRAQAAWQQLNDATRARRLAYLQAEFEDRRRAQELQLLRQQERLAELREANASARRTTRMLGGATLVIIVLLLIALLWRFRLDRRRYRRLSERDGLTGLFNHSRFHQKVEDALSEARRQHRVCTLVAADVDLFKQINDRYGHQAGDAVLRSLSAQLRERFPAPCIVGRVGGEEFAIFLPGHNRLQARQRIRALQESVQPAEHEGRTIEFTLSFGLAEARGSNVRLEQLRSSADHALYRAKRAGRNQLFDASDLSDEVRVSG